MAESFWKGGEGIKWFVQTWHFNSLVGYIEYAIDRLALTRLKHHHPNTPPCRFICVVLRVDTSGNGRGPVVVEVKVQLAVTGAEFEGFEEDGVVEEGEGVEDVEVGLRLGN